MADYAGNLVALPLDSLGTHLLPGDSRLDPWLRGAPRYFGAELNGERRELWYVRLPALAGLPGATRKALERQDILLPGFTARSSPARRAIGLALGMAGLAFIIVKDHGRVATGLLGLPWLLLVQAGGAAALALSGLLVVPALAGAGARLPVWEGGRPPWRAEELRALFPDLLAALYPLYAAWLVMPALLPSFALAMAASFALMAAARIPSPLLPPGGRKRAFIPVRIQKSAGRPYRPSHPRHHAALGLLAVLPLLLIPAFPGGGSGEAPMAPGLRLPLPQARSGNTGGLGDTLPGLAEYRAHLETQRGFFTHRLPATEGEAMNAGSDAGIQGPVGERAATSAKSPISLERLLLDQGPGLSVKVSLAGSWEAPPLAPSAVILYILPLIVALAAALIRGGDRPAAKNRNTT